MRNRTFPQPRVHFSELKRFSLSPAHYRAAVIEPREPPAAWRFGSLVHALVLGGTRVAVFEGEARRGKAWDTFEAEHDDGDTLLVTRPEHDRAQRVARTVFDDPIVRTYGVLSGRKEVTLRWRYAGRECEGTIDVLGDRHLAELKTCSLAAPGFFERQSLRLAYHAQLAWYRNAAAANGVDVADCYVVAVETSAPFAVTVFRATPRALDQGERLCRIWIERLEVCEGAQKGGHWPAYAEHVVPLDVPDDEPDLVFAEDADAT